MEVLFVAGVAPIAPDVAASTAFYEDALGIALEGDDYRYTSALAGVKHFGVWPLEQAAMSCFGSSQWPDDVPRPHAVIEFEVRDVADAASELAERGYRLIHDARLEPWGQTVARLLSPEGLLVGVTITPWLHDDA